RAIYTRWRRNLPYPSMVTFDVPERNVCAMRRMRTNTPLQALVTLNDPVFIECAQGLARRLLSETSDTSRRARRIISLVLGRSATPREASRLIELYEQSRQQLESAPQNASSLACEPL